MRTGIRSQAGFSLVEVMISLVLLSIIALFIFSNTNKTQKAMFKGTSRDAHTQVVSVVKNKSGKTLQQIFTAANTNPASILTLLNTEVNLGEGIRLNWAKPQANSNLITMKYAANPSQVAQESLESCKKSKTYPKAWQAGELPTQLAASRLVFCGQMQMPADPDSSYGSQNMSQAEFGFLNLDVTFTKVLDGTAIPLSQFGAGGTIATVTWTLVWSYQKGPDVVQQFRKGIYHIVP